MKNTDGERLPPEKEEILPDLSEMALIVLPLLRRMMREKAEKKQDKDGK